MDVDERTSMMSETSPFFQEVPTFAKTDELTVTFYANLPSEVKRDLKNAGAQHFWNVSRRGLWLL